jgi:hypothetical protein
MKHRKRRTPSPPPRSSAAELLRKIAEQDPERHKAALGRAYGAGPGIDVVNWKPGDEAPVVVLDRIEPGVTPDYCVHGRATCIACPEWVWLGDETYELVKSGAALPLCQPCATKYVTRGTPKIGKVKDHRRADGPH